MSAEDENATHTEAMKKVQSAHREKMSEKKEADRGLFLILTGDGKGKSSSAFGSIIRALGWGHSVGVVQYVKGNWKTGEIRLSSSGIQRITQLTYIDFWH